MALSDHYTDKFVHTAARLAEQFPQLDLRFHRTMGETSMRCMLPEVSPEALEFDLAVDAEQIHFEAVFSIKELAQLFDA